MIQTKFGHSTFGLLKRKHSPNLKLTQSDSRPTFGWLERADYPLIKRAEIKYKPTTHLSGQSPSIWFAN